MENNIKNTNLIPPSPQINVETLRPFTRFCVTIGALPTSYMLSLTYEEQVLWFCKFLQDTVIPALNNNGEAVAELQALYVELKNYVDNYFKNLDVQEEINNKLDEMVQDGTLAQIINDQIFNELNNKVTALEKRKIYDYLASDYETIQEAIDAATANNSILYIDKNINEENTSILATCSLIGINNPKIKCFHISIENSNINIENLDITAYDTKVFYINKNSSLSNIIIKNNKCFLNNQDANFPLMFQSISTNFQHNNVQILNNYSEIGGIEATKISNIKIQGNYIDGKMKTSSKTELIHTSFKTSGIISENFLLNSNYDFIDIYTSGEKMIISNNIMINGNMNGIEAKVVLSDNQENTSSTTNGFVENVIIMGNYISNLNGMTNYRFAGILAVMYDERTLKTPLPSENETPKNLIITNNIIKHLNYINTNCYYCGIKTTGNNTIISNNIIQDVKNIQSYGTAGIFVFSENNTPKNLQIIGNRLKGCFPYSIYIQNCTNANINENIFEKDNEGNNENFGNNIALAIQNGKNININGNLIDTTNNYGILQIIPDNTLENINILNNTLINSGISLTNAEKVNISNNNINGHYSTGIPGINIDYSNIHKNLKIINNNICNTETGAGIFIKNVQFGLIQQNICDNSSYLINIIDNSSNLRITDNIMTDSLNDYFNYYSNVPEQNKSTITIENNMK